MADPSIESKALVSHTPVGQVSSAFRLIARDTNAATLSEIWRFRHHWERDASVQLRHGIPAAITTYTDHDRVRTGTPDAMQDAAYAAWHTDERAGQRSLLIAADNTTVIALNTRARVDRIATGAVEPAAVRLRDGTEAGVGDRIVTRLNRRRIITDHGRYVRNGNEWVVTRRWHDGSLTARGHNGDTVTLPAAYVADSVELGYATTAHRAQGATVDTAHLLVTESLSREVLYVGMTRGRRANRAYVVTVNSHDELHQHRPERTARDVLEDIMRRADAERSAHEVMRAELDDALRLDRLVPMHEHICQLEAGHRYRALLERSGLAEHLPELLRSPAYGPLLAALRHAESRGLPADEVLRDAIGRAPFDTAKDIAAVLHGRVDRQVRRAERRGHLRPEVTIAGVVNPVPDVADPALAHTLDDLEDLIADRAALLARRALSRGEPWLEAIGRPPREHLERLAWDDIVSRIAAYRERHGVRGPEPLGPRPSAKDFSHTRDWQHLRAHLQSAPTLPANADAAVEPAPTITVPASLNRHL